MVITESLIDKYNVPVPRYTSYPTVPAWKENQPLKSFHEIIDTEILNDGISLYLHLPFCEVLCTYCGCNKRITKNHSVEGKYIEYILKEWKMYLELLPTTVILKELHLGGGTPTFFSPANLNHLISSLYEGVVLHDDFEASFEGHPNNTTREHLQTLFDLGFKRVSFGVQDLDHKVQVAIHRIQPHENVVKVVNFAREIGYTSINFDLIYGLPFQNLNTISDTFNKVIDLLPDRIAFYSYAHVPWVSKSQRAYDENDLPQGSDKRALYEQGKELLIKSGYRDIGMDHFSLVNDSLYRAQTEKKLHRNFMGYTTNNAKISIGLGVSSISDFYWGYRQNVKKLEEYYEILDQDILPIFKGIDLTKEDTIQRQHILDITCNFQTQISETELMKLDNTYFYQLVEDGLIDYYKDTLKITDLGQSFIRNIAALFDPNYRFVSDSQEKMYSSSV